MNSEEDKLSAEDKKRRLKTPSQVAALEEFYNEHKYPSEEMKSEFASKLGLTEKQISRWFCHRRLKDKNRLKDDTCMSGKHDLSNSVLQDRGSGLRQDSCGSTKQGDYMHFDPREVESRRFCRQDYPSAVLASEIRGQDKRTKDYGTVSDTSSGSSSGPQDRLLPSRYSSWDSNSMLMNTKGVKGRGYMMASEYLYLQDEIENPAISAVKKQLGRRYRPDGPPIGVEFQPLPPGAFDAPLGDSIQEPYYVGDPSLQNSHSISRVKKENSVGMAHGIHRYKSYPHGSCTEGSGFRRTVWESDHQKESISYPSSQRSFTNYYYHGPDKNSVLEMDADSAAEASVFKSNSFRTSSKQRVEQTSISSKGSLRLYDRNINPNESHYSPLRNDDIGSHEFKTREYFQLGASNSVLQHCEPLDADDKFNSRKLTKRYLEKRVNEHKTISNPLRTKTLRQEMKMGKRLKGTEFPRLDSTLRTPPQEQPWKKPIKGMSEKARTKDQKREKAPRAIWSDTMKKVLVDLCVEQVDLSGKPGTNFRNSVWNEILKKFTAKTGLAYNQKQLRNGLDQMKKSYTVYLELCSQTGVGINEETHTVTMDNERWDEYIEKHPDAKIFRTKPLPFPEEMKKLFGGSSATGEDKWSPFMGELPCGIEDNQVESTLDLTIDDDELKGGDIDETVEVKRESIIEQARSKVKGKVLKGRRSSTSSSSDHQIDRMMELIEEESRNKKARQQEAINEEKPTLEECIKVLRAMDGMSTSNPLYIVAFNEFEKKYNRQVWMMLDDDVARNGWLEMKFRMGNY